MSLHSIAQQQTGKRSVPRVDFGLQKPNSTSVMQRRTFLRLLGLAPAAAAVAAEASRSPGPGREPVPDWDAVPLDDYCTEPMPPQPAPLSVDVGAFSPSIEEHMRHVQARFDAFMGLNEVVRSSRDLRSSDAIRIALVEELANQGLVAPEDVLRILEGAAE